MWMYTASLNPLVLLPPALLALTSSHLKSELPEVVALVSDTKGSHSVKQRGTFLPHTAPSPPCHQMAPPEMLQDLQLDSAHARN